MLQAGLWLFVSNVLRALMGLASLKLKSIVLLYFSYVIQCVIVFLGLVWFVFLQIYRWSHSGRVCSGDYIPGNHSLQGYLVVQGQFIFWLIFTVYLLIFMVLCAVGCVT